MKEKATDILKKLREYRLVLLLVFAGIALLLWPSKETAAEEDSIKVTADSEEAWLREIEQQLAETLSHIEGTGALHLMLTVEQGMEKRYTEDTDIREGENTGERSYETVILTDSGRNETLALETQAYPIFRGAIVVCEGGDRASVRLAVTEAVRVLTGLSSDKITVVKGS